MFHKVIKRAEVKKKSKMSQGERKEMKYTLAFHAEGKTQWVPETGE